jgi:hypothetical protein
VQNNIAAIATEIKNNREVPVGKSHGRQRRQMGG